MKWTQIHRDVLRCSMHRAKLSIGSLAKLLPYKQHIIRRALDNLIESKVIQKSVMCDMYRLGYTPHCLHFSISPKSGNARKKVLSRIMQHPQISWLGEMAGDMEHELSFLAKHPRELGDFIDSLSEEFPDIFEKRLYAIELEHHYFGYKYVSSRPVPVPTISFYDTASPIAIDTVDAKILRGLSVNGNLPASVLARKLGIVHTTFAYRYERLCKLGVLSEEVYFLNRNTVSAPMFNLTLSVTSNPKCFREKFKKFCSNHLNIYCCHRCIGAWDYKLSLIGDSRQEVIDAIDEIKETFAAHISGIRVTTMMRDIKNDYFPFENLTTDNPPTAKGKRN